MYELYLATTTDHLWSTMWLRVVTSNATSTTIDVFVLKKTPFDTHMYELYLGTDTDHLWLTTWSKVVTSNANSTTKVFVWKNDTF